MNNFKIIIPVVALLLTASQASAQGEARTPDPAAAGQYARDAEAREAEVERRLAEAEERMAEAARQIAELTTERLPQIHRVERRIGLFNDGRPRLGVTIGAADEGPVAGVRVVGVTPGSAASDAGLRAGDVITAVNDEALSADSAETANRKLLDFMRGVEDGDVLAVEYLRDGKVGEVEVEPRPVDVFAAGPGPGPAPNLHLIPGFADDVKNRFMFSWSTAGWGDMELVELSEGLGRYFGTSEGLLVVRAPASSALKLEDGDVIQSIDGRKPTSVRHAMRILGSYEAGEQLELEIMRDRKRRTLEVVIPEDLDSQLLPDAPSPLSPAMAPLPRRPESPVERS
jgi:membrane-associated protease RseP (regulator of RpoE activity)